MRKRAGLIIGVIVPLAVLVFLGWRLILPSPTPAPLPSAISGIACAPSCRYAGIAVAKPSAVGTFMTATGIRPGIVTIYVPFTAKFPKAWAEQMVRSKVLPMIQINPRKTSLSQIAAGKYDAQLTSYGDAVKRFHHRVALSFGHEMNGRWYPWGCGHVPARVFVAAWRHIVDQIRAAGATNVIWVWTANVQASHDCPLAARFPGNSYVTWIGVDGYLRKPTSTFSRIFGGTLRRIKGFSSKPILIAEAGANSGPRWSERILSLYQGAATAKNVIGVVYFDSATHKYGNYRPQANKAALAAFKRGVHMLLSGTG